MIRATASPRRSRTRDQRMVGEEPGMDPTTDGARTSRMMGKKLAFVMTVALPGFLTFAACEDAKKPEQPGVKLDGLKKLALVAPAENELIDREIVELQSA